MLELSWSVGYEQESSSVLPSEAASSVALDKLSAMCTIPDNLVGVLRCTLNDVLY